MPRTPLVSLCRFAPSLHLAEIGFMPHQKILDPLPYVHWELFDQLPLLREGARKIPSPNQKGKNLLYLLFGSIFQFFLNPY